MSEQPLALHAGMRVTARFLASSRGPANTQWFSGTVRSVHHDGRADIDYDDGDAEDLVSPRYIRVFKQQAAPEKLAALIADVDDAADADAAAAAAVASAPAARMLRLCGYLGCPLVEGTRVRARSSTPAAGAGARAARRRPRRRPARRAPTPAPAPEAAAEPSAATPSPAAALPPGWSREQRTAQPSGRKYYIFHGPAGEKFDSAAKAWRKHREANGEQEDEKTQTPAMPTPADGAAAPAPAAAPALEALAEQPTEQSLREAMSVAVEFSAAPRRRIRCSKSFYSSSTRRATAAAQPDGGGGGVVPADVVVGFRGSGVAEAAAEAIRASRKRAREEAAAPEEVEEISTEGARGGSTQFPSSAQWAAAGCGPSAAYRSMAAAGDEAEAPRYNACSALAPPMSVSMGGGMGGGMAPMMGGGMMGNNGMMGNLMQMGTQIGTQMGLGPMQAGMMAGAAAAGMMMGGMGGCGMGGMGGMGGGMGGGMPQGMMGGMPQQQMGGGYGGGGGSFAPQPPARTPSAAEEQLRSALAAAGMGVGGLSFDERLEPGRWDGWAVDCTLNGNVLGTGRGRTADAAREQAATQVLGSLSAMQSGADPPPPAAMPAPPPPAYRSMGGPVPPPGPPPPQSTSIGGGWREGGGGGGGGGRGGRHGSRSGGGFGNSRWGGGRGGDGRPPPATYICNRCKVGGHWIHDCPTLKKGRGRGRG